MVSLKLVNFLGGVIDTHNELKLPIKFTIYAKFYHDLYSLFDELTCLLDLCSLSDKK
jgi:hypothetical protein